MNLIPPLARIIDEVFWSPALRRNGVETKFLLMKCFIQQANSNEIIFEESQFNSKNANNQNWKELLQMTLMESERALKFDENLTRLQFPLKESLMLTYKFI